MNQYGRSHLAKTESVKLPQIGSSISCVNNQLFFNVGMNTICIWNTDMSNKRHVEVKHVGTIFGLAPLLDLTMVVACSKGLFHISNTGNRFNLAKVNTHNCL